MNILLIEDEKLAAEKLITLLGKICPDSEVIQTLDSVDTAIAYLKNNDEPDLIISDIHLTDGLCFSIYTEVKVKCPIIFATAYEKYAIQAFEVNSIDYLLKPIQESRLEQAINKYKQLHAQEEDNSSLYEEFQKLLVKKNRNYKSTFL